MAPAAVAEHLGQLPLHDRCRLGDGDAAARFGRQRADSGIADAAGDDAVIPGQVAVAVQRESVHGDAPGHPSADRAQLAVRPRRRVAQHPRAAATCHPRGGHPEFGARPDERFLERAHVGHHVKRLAELDDRVAGQLPGPVPGDLAAAVHVDHRGARVAERPVRCGCPLAGRIHGLVFEQQAAVGRLVGDPPGVHASLQIPAFEVADRGVKAKVDKLTHFSQLTPGRAAGPTRPPRGKRAA